MMKTTSSSSVDGTTEGSRQDQTGRQSIEKNSVNTWTPEEKNAAVRDFLERHGPEMKQMSDWDFFWWNLKATVFHWFGVHTLTARETWQKGLDRRLRITKTGMGCWKCEYRE